MASEDPGLQAVLTLVQEQLRASAEREGRLTKMLEQLATKQQSASPTLPSKTVSAERPILLASATMADFVAWHEAWEDYSRCQHLASQDAATRFAAIRQALDEDLRRYIRQGTIVLPANPDTPDVIAALQAYLRRQRNPLLDRMAFYDRRQQKGEPFDAFLTSLNELFKASDFSTSVCSTCSASLCSPCRDAVRQRHADMMRDRIVCGIWSDEVRHKLLAATNLTLESAVKLCRTEEAAFQTNDGLPSSGQVHRTRNVSTYKKRQHKSKSATSIPTPPASGKPAANGTAKPKCPSCGRSAHTKNPCPALDRTCNHCKEKGHFQSVCPKLSLQPASGRGKIAHLTLKRTAAIPNLTCVPAATRLNTAECPVDLDWIPDTGSDVDAIGLQQLSILGGFPENLDKDLDMVFNADGGRLASVGKITATISLGSVKHDTTIHVYDGLTDALLSRASLTALGLLPAGLPRQVLQAKSGSTPAPEEFACIRLELLTEFADVFDEATLKPMNGPVMDIIIPPDAQPHSVNGARPIPFAYRDQIKSQLDEMLTEGIIEAVNEPSNWCHPIVIVNKKGTSEKRLTVDLRKLNDQVSRPTHPMTTPRAALSAIGSSPQYFTTLDARHGYWQIPLSDAAKPLTTFITPWGRYRFRRNPQGLISAGDVFNHRTDSAFANLPNFVKVVDDCLVHDDDFVTHVQHVRNVLLRARQHGITFSARKFVFGASEVPFCGYVVGRNGWTLDESKTAAIRDFPVPINRTDLRSFFGLINQCAPFSNRLSELCSPLRALLKTTNEFFWDDTHTAAFKLVKDALISPPVLAHFRLGQPLRLETDASVLHGLGYALWQQQGEHWCLIECGSRFLSDAESRYAVIELECLAVVWAVKKCALFLQGAKFEIVTDHRPLIPILNSYSLDQIENPRLQRLVLKLRSYQLHASWRKGSDNAFADALSRHPVHDPTPDDEYGEDPALSGSRIRACLLGDQDSPILDLRQHSLLVAAKTDSDYQLLLTTVLNGFPDRKAALSPTVAPFWTFREHLSVDDGLVWKGERVVVPRSLRRSVLNDLHAAHQGLTRTKQRARQTVFWPNMTNDLENVVRSCPQCRLHAASQPKEPLLVEDRDPSLPFESTSADLFACRGWQYLVYVDRLSGWPCLYNAGRSVTSAGVIRLLRRWFADLGVPQVLTTDGGPQFASQQFAAFCRRWQIRHVISSPHYPQSNGHAEAAVKAMKTLVMKTTTNGNLDVDSFQRGLLEWRNTPSSSGFSPAHLLFGRPLDSFVFARRAKFAQEWQSKFASLDRSTPADRDPTDVTDPCNRPAHALPSLSVGVAVDIQDHATKLWHQHGIIVSVGRHRDYYIRLPSGRVLRRNRRHLRPRILPMPNPAPSPGEPAPASRPAPRRSSRPRRQPARFHITSTLGQSYD